MNPHGKLRLAASASVVPEQVRPVHEIEGLLADAVELHRLEEADRPYVLVCRYWLDGPRTYYLGPIPSIAEVLSVAAAQRGSLGDGVPLTMRIEPLLPFEGDAELDELDAPPCR